MPGETDQPHHVETQMQEPHVGVCACELCYPAPPAIIKCACTRHEITLHKTLQCGDLPHEIHSYISTSNPINYLHINDVGASKMRASLEGQKRTLEDAEMPVDGPDGYGWR
jgi:hypothetical protein